MKRGAFIIVISLIVSILGAPFISAQISTIKSPFVSDDFIKSAQNIPFYDNNNLDEIYYKVMTLKRTDPGLNMLSQREKDDLIGKIQLFQNRNGGFGDWKKDRSKIGSTRRALEALTALGAQPANKTGVVSFIGRLQLFNLQYGNFGFKSYLRDSDADLQATYNAVKSFALLNEPIPNEQGVIAYLKIHQNNNGGFGYQTIRQEGIFWTSTALDTHRGVRALSLLGSVPDFEQEAITFLQGLQTSDGGFASASSITKGTTASTFNAVEALQSLGASPLQENDVIQFLNNNKKLNGGFLENVFDTAEGPHSTYWAIATLSALGEPVAGHPAENYVLNFGSSENDGGFGNAPGRGSNIRFTFDAVFALNLIGKKPTGTRSVSNFLLNSRNLNGGYGLNGISSTESTYRAVYSLLLLGQQVPNKDETIQYLKSAQNLDGGFGWSTSSVSRNSYTFRTIKVLDLLGARPDNPKGTIQYLQSLQNSDGGFGNYIGDLSDIGSTYRAIAALDLINSRPLDSGRAEDFIKNAQNPGGGFRKRPSATIAPSNFSLAVYTYDAIRSLDILNANFDQTAVYNFIISLRNPDLAYGQQPFFTSTVSDTFTSLFSYFILFPGQFNSPPLLSNIGVTPTTGDARTLFKFSITYKDTQNQFPEEIFLVLNEDKEIMVPLNSSDSDVTDGKDYVIETFLPIGDNRYSFSASDGIDSTDSVEFNLFVDSVGNAPILEMSVSPVQGDENTGYTFQAIYTDADNELPSFVRLKINDEWFDMNAADNVNNVVNGKTYVYETKLPPGLYRFRGKASDGINQVLTIYTHSPVVISSVANKPTPEIFEKIKALILSEYDDTITPEDVERSVYLGRFAWKVNVKGETVWVSRDGTDILTPSDFLWVYVSVIILILGIAGLIVFIVIKKRRARGEVTEVYLNET